MRVSVVIPVYNAEAYLEHAVRSALSQGEVGEVLLVEDGSSDGSLAMCTRLASEDDRVRVLQHPRGENRGAGATRNLGIRSVQCDLVAFLDADDYYLPQRFCTPVQIMTARPEVDGVYEAVGIHLDNDAAARWWHALHGERQLATVREPVEPDKLFHGMLSGRVGSFHTDGICVRRELFAKSGEFDAELRMCQDTAMWLRMACVGRLEAGRLDEPVAMYRLHGDNRVMKESRRHVYWGVEMGRCMLNWARKSRDDELAATFYQHWYDRWQWYSRETDSRLSSRLELAGLWWRMARQYPPVWGRRSFWGLLKGALMQGGSASCAPAFTK